ncbi:MAG TPA: zinc ribbon domain-containing protein [Ktedonobacteraceae bacterium]|nr:zinc ribbon domain-containing protein [Ktedonobacteraceae bacterium]
MDTRYYNAPDINLERLATELEHMFVAQGFETQHFGSSDHMTVQLRKGGDMAAIFGLRSALTVVLQRNPEGLQAAIGQQRWIDKAAVGAVGFFIPILWPLMFTAGAGTLMQASLGNQVLNALDMLVHQQAPNAQRGPGAAPSFHMPNFNMPHFHFGQTQTAYAPAPVICPNCQTPNEPGDKYCMQCGNSLESKQEEKVHCSNCGADMRPGAAFCTKCGASAAA